MTLARLTPLVLIALFAASCSGSDKSSSPPATTATTPTTSGTTTGSTGAKPEPPAANASLTVGSRDVYPLLSGSLTRFVSKPVTATSATIVQVAGIDSFWAGKNGSQQVLVKVDLKKGGRPPKLEAGRQVSFSGKFVKAPKSGESLGVKAKSGQPQLTKQGAFILVPASQLHLQ
jgi:hypothetical protein